MNIRFKIYMAILVIEILLGVVLRGFISDNIPPTAPATAEDLKEFRLDFQSHQS